jgi:penicillin amidase
MTNFTHVGRTIGLTSLTLGAAAGLVSMGALAAFRRSLPRTDGSLRVPGVQQPVEIRRDRWGVPHIYAASSDDVFVALGYVHAQERLWQMELNRATATGHLAEIFGSAALDSDRFVRVMGFGRQAERDAAHLDEPTHAATSAYVRGINAFLETNHSRLPLEFALLRHHPRPWQVSDTLAWSKLIAYGLSFNWTAELIYDRLAALLGVERARALMLNYPDDHPVTAPANSLTRRGIGPEALQPAERVGPVAQHGRWPPRNGTRKSLHLDHPGEGSNAWVVRGQRSSSGKPLLASDPHLRATLPVICYEAHLHGGDYHVSGATFPGMPGVAIGHNERIAWGVTNGMADVQDLYIERFHPEDPLRYEWSGGWEQAEMVREEIMVKGQAEPVVEEVIITRHGPIIGPVAAPPDTPLEGGEHEPPPDAAAPSPTHEALALRWTGFESSRAIGAALAINRARSWDDFRAAVAEWDVPAQNFIYADTDGHYGYLMGGTLPIRARGDGRLPVPGWDGTHEWVGYIPPTDLPAALDPPDGLAISCNNRIADQSYPYAAHLPGEWLNGYRARRIRDMLDATPQHDPQSFAHMQLDQHSLPGRELAALLADLSFEEPLEQQARDLLTQWDGELGPDSVGGAIYISLRYHLERLAYADMGDLLTAPVGVGFFQIATASEMLNRRAMPGILRRIKQASGEQRADPWLGAERTWNDLLRESLQRAVAELSQRHGNDPKGWKYSRQHSLSLRHVLGKSPMLAPIFNRGNWPTGGDIDTVCMGYMPRDTADYIYIAPVYRQICDTGNWDASISVMLGGQSGHPASRHYCDLTPLWLRGDYHPMLWSRERVEQHTVATLTLEPDDEGQRSPT